MTHPQTIQRLNDLGLKGMAMTLDRQNGLPGFMDLGFDQKMAMLIDAEVDARNDRRLARLLKQASLKLDAHPEDIDYRPGRGLDKGAVADVLSLNWLDRHKNGVICGPCGAGKTWFTCAIGMQAARQGFTVQYHRTNLLLEAMEVGYHNGALAKIRSGIAKARLLILDDFGLAKLTPRNKQDLLELVDARVGKASIIIAGQLPREDWHAFIDDPALADAILDRVVHNAFNIQLTGESMRKLRAKS